MSEYAFVVMSCDLYCDLWPDFFSLKKKYANDIDANTYLVSNKKVFDDDSVVTITCDNELNWTGRLLKCLDSIPEKYVILMLDDYYISNTVNVSELEDLFAIIKKENIGYCKLETRRTKFPDHYKDYEYLREITPDIRYGVSLITSIWNTDFLKEVIGGEDYEAWEFEIRRNRKDDITKTTGRICICDIRNILNITHMVQRGRYINESVKKIQKTDLLHMGNRRTMGKGFDFYLKCVNFLKQNEFLRKRVVKVTNLFGIKSLSQKYENEMEEKRYV